MKMVSLDIWSGCFYVLCQVTLGLWNGFSVNASEPSIKYLWSFTWWEAYICQKWIFILICTTWKFYSLYIISWNRINSLSIRAKLWLSLLSGKTVKDASYSYAQRWPVAVNCLYTSMKRLARVQVLVYKSLHGLAPKYISDMLEPYEPTGTENLREGSPAGAQSQD